jgi:hypothetical protein
MAARRKQCVASRNGRYDIQSQRLRNSAACTLIGVHRPTCIPTRGLNERMPFARYRQQFRRRAQGCPADYPCRVFREHGVAINLTGKMQIRSIARSDHDDGRLVGRPVVFQLVARTDRKHPCLVQFLQMRFNNREKNVELIHLKTSRLSCSFSVPEI